MAITALSCYKVEMKVSSPFTTRALFRLSNDSIQLTNLIVKEKEIIFYVFC